MSRGPSIAVADRADAVSMQIASSAIVGLGRER